MLCKIFHMALNSVRVVEVFTKNDLTKFIHLLQKFISITLIGSLQFVWIRGSYSILKRI